MMRKVLFKKITLTKIQSRNGTNAQKERKTLIRKHLVTESGRTGKAGGRNKGSVQDAPRQK